MSETSIPCSKVLRNRLRDCGKKGDSWEKVLTELIDDAEKFRELKKGFIVQGMDIKNGWNNV